MSTRDPRRRASSYRVEHPGPADRTASADGSGPDGPGPDGPGQGGPSAGAVPGGQSAETGPGSAAGGPVQATGRMATRGVWVDHLVDEAIRRGDFDDLPLAGKPIPGLGPVHDPDWWLKGLVRREHVGGDGVLPEALALRGLDERLDARLDTLRHEDRVRAVLQEFNDRVVAARRQLTGGPPVLTPLRDVEAEVEAWRDRRRLRGSAGGPGAGTAAGGRPDGGGADRPPRRRWWRRGGA